MTSSSVVNNKPPSFSKKSTEVSSKELQQQISVLKMQHTQEIQHLNNELKKSSDRESLNDKIIHDLRSELLLSQQEIQSLHTEHEMKLNEIFNNNINDHKQLTIKYEQELNDAKQRIHHQKLLMEASNAEITQQQLIINDLTQLCQTNNFNYMALQSFRMMENVIQSSNNNNTVNADDDTQYPKPDKLLKMIRETSARMASNISSDISHQQRNESIANSIEMDSGVDIYDRIANETLADEPFFVTAAVHPTDKEKDKNINQKPDMRDYNKHNRTLKKALAKKMKDKDTKHKKNDSEISINDKPHLFEHNASNDEENIDWMNVLDVDSSLIIEDDTDSETKCEEDGRETHTRNQSQYNLQVLCMRELEEKNQQLMIEARQACKEISVLHQKMEQMQMVFDRDYENYLHEKQRLQSRIKELNEIIDEMNKSHMKVRKISMQSNDDLCLLYKELREKERIIEEQTGNIDAVQKKIKEIEHVNHENDTELLLEMKELKDVNRRNSIVIEEYEDNEHHKVDRDVSFDEAMNEKELELNEKEKKLSEKRNYIKICEQNMDDMMLEIEAYKETIKIVREKNLMLSSSLSIKEHIYKERIECSDIAFQQMLNILTQSNSMKIKTLNEENDDFRMEIERIHNENKGLSEELNYALRSKIDLVQSFNQEMERIRNCLKYQFK